MRVTRLVLSNCLNFALCWDGPASTSVLPLQAKPPCRVSCKTRPAVFLCDAHLDKWPEGRSVSPASELAAERAAVHSKRPRSHSATGGGAGSQVGLHQWHRRSNTHRLPGPPPEQEPQAGLLFRRCPQGTNFGLLHTSGKDRRQHGPNPSGSIPQIQRQAAQNRRKASRFKDDIRLQARTGRGMEEKARAGKVNCTPRYD